MRQSLFDVLGNGGVDVIVHTFRAGLASCVAGIVMILSRGASFQFAATGYFYFFDERFSGFEFRHKIVSIIIYSGTMRAENPIGPRFISSSKR